MPVFPRLRAFFKVRVLPQAVELAVAAVLAVVGFAYLASPEYRNFTAVGRAFHGIDIAWCLAFILGGVWTVHGHLGRKRALLSAGLSLLGFALLLEGLASFLVPVEHFPTTAKIVSVLVIFALVAAFEARALFIAWGGDRG